MICSTSEVPERAIPTTKTGVAEAQPMPSNRDMAARGVAPRLADVYSAWSTTLDEILAEATLERPRDVPYSWHGKRGEHSEHLGYILTEMQYLQRAYPGARW